MAGATGSGDGTEPPDAPADVASPIKALFVAETGATDVEPGSVAVAPDEFALSFPVEMVFVVLETAAVPLDPAESGELVEAAATSEFPGVGEPEAAAATPV